MRRIVYLLPLLGALAGAFALLLTMAGARSAPQEAAGFAMACAFAVVPYVLARAIDFMYSDDNRQRQRQTDALEKMARTLTSELKETA